MALFSRKTKKVEFEVKESTVKVKKASLPKEKIVKEHSATPQDLSAVLLRPRITEKASMKAENNVYAFDVAPRATKTSITAAVTHYYKVTPRKVAIVKIPTKAITYRNRKGVRSGGKKAYIYLAKGQTIDFT